MKFDFAFDKYLAQLMPKGLALVTFFIIKLLVKSKVKIGNDGDDCGDIGDDDVAYDPCHFFFHSKLLVQSKVKMGNECGKEAVDVQKIYIFTPVSK